MIIRLEQGSWPERTFDWPDQDRAGQNSKSVKTADEEDGSCSQEREISTKRTDTEVSDRDGKSSAPSSGECPMGYAETPVIQ
jgi:hypothetical protein